MQLYYDRACEAQQLSPITVLCRTVSNAFQKSRAKTSMDVRMTNSMVHTVCRRATIAATVEPIGLNANIFEQQK